MSRAKRSVTAINKKEEALRKQLKSFTSIDPVKSVFNLALPILGYIISIILLIYLEKNGHYTLLVPTLVFSALLVVKLFTVQHDAGHGSFSKSKVINLWVGRLCSVFTFIPYESWRREHSAHHKHFAKIDQRTLGDILILSTDEYRRLGIVNRLLYRSLRNPIFFIVVAPLGYFLVRSRIPIHCDRAAMRSVIAHNFVLTGLYGSFSYFLGWQYLIGVFLPILYLAGLIGVLTFLMEHQYKNGKWFESDDWSFYRACFESCSCFQLPRVLEWFMGNVGYHHVHHMNPGIPSYRIRECYDATPILQVVPRLQLGDVMTSLKSGLWSKERNRIVSFSEL